MKRIFTIHSLATALLSPTSNDIYHQKIVKR